MKALSPGLGKETLRTLAAVIAAMFTVHLIFSLTTPLLALTLEREGVSPALIGLNTMAQPAAAFLAAPLAPLIMARLGAKRLMLAALVLTALCLLGTKLWVNFWYWLPLRFLMGAAGSVLWIASEAWINTLAQDHNRGRILGIYGTAGALGLALGPLVLALAGSEGWAAYLIGVALLGLGGLTLLIPGAALPTFSAEKRGLGIWRYFWLAPVPMLIHALIAAGEDSMLTFLPIYGGGLGVSERETLWLLTIFSLGIVFLQAPVGWLADRLPKAPLLAFMLLGSLAIVLAHPWFLPVRGLNQLVYFLYGGLFSSMYIIAVMLIGERFRGEELVRATAAFSMMWGLGSSAGPPVVGAAMDLLPEAGLANGYVLAQTAFIAALLWMPWLLRRR
jgi:MFS family permease